MRASVSVLLTAQSPGTEAFEVVPAYALLQARRDRGLGPQLRDSQSCSGRFGPMRHCCIIRGQAIDD